MVETQQLPEWVQLAEVPQCNVCGCPADRFLIWDKARNNTLKQCPDCKLVFTSPRIPDSQVKDKVIYSEAYFKQASRMTPKLIEARRTSYQLEVKALEKWIPKGRILDVGCGIGIFLDAFGPHWERHGCDVSSYALSEAEKRGVQVKHGEFEVLDYEGQQFDVVYFRASLHHAYQPFEALLKAQSLLRPGGVLAIAMSNNHSGPMGRLFRGHVKSYEQAHNYLFSKETLQFMLEKCQLHVVHSEYPYLGTRYGSWSDLTAVIPFTIRYVLYKFLGKLNQPNTWDLATPPFPGNYVNIYAIKP